MYLRATTASLFSLIVAVGCASHKPAAYDPQATRAAIATGLPEGWSLEGSSLRQTGLTEAYFRSPRTDAFLLRGPRPGSITWTDRQGRVHREAMGRECLWLWLVPSDFDPSFPSFLNPCAASPPVRVAASRGLRAYGMVQRDDDANDRRRLNEIMENATVIEGDEVRPSWTRWRRDIATRITE